MSCVKKGIGLGLGHIGGGLDFGWHPWFVFLICMCIALSETTHPGARGGGGGADCPTKDFCPLTVTKPFKTIDIAVSFPYQSAKKHGIYY